MRPAALLALLALGGWGAWSAVAASGPATPTITSAPANPTNLTSAAFTYAASGATSFRCRLDSAAAPTTCPLTGITYTGLAAGQHRFEVQALDKKGSASSLASYSWSIDRTAPGAPTISAGPSGLVSSASATFSFGGEPGATFQCALESTASPAACTSPAAYSSLAQGAHTFYVRQVDLAGNVGAAFASRSWTVDTVAPQAPVIGTKPDDPNGDGIANFDWTDADPSVHHYTCSLENKPATTCTSPLRTIVDVSNDGQHQFAVSAVDAAGNARTTTYSWKVLKAVNVVVDGDAVGLLYPGGAARPIALRLHNPNNFPIVVTSVDVSARTSPAGCAADDNVELRQSDLGHGASPRTVTVAANSILTVPGDLRPTIRLRETGRNQDACKLGSFQLSYVAIGGK